MSVFLHTFQLGLRSLWLHPMRSLLTVLGIFIGVASVIWLLAIGEGISQVAQRQIEGLGAQNIIVRSIKPPAELAAAFSGPIPYGIKRADFEMLRQTLPTLEENGAVPIREIRRTVSYGGRDVDGRLVGCTPEYQEVMKLKIHEGDFFTEVHNRQRVNVCVLAERLARELFPYENPLGRSVYLSENKDYYRVIGVLEHRGATAAIGGSLEAQDFSSDMYVPIDTVRQQISDLVVTRRGSNFSSEIVELNQVTLRVDSVDNVRKTAALVRKMLNVEPDRKAGAVEEEANGENGENGETIPDSYRQDIDVVVPEELLEQARVTKFMFMLFMGLIAAISLLVGGIGIMNIMLATVTERTREIGIRRALGATQQHIVMQFLAETISLSVVGGATGILGGLLCPAVINATRYLAKAYAPELMSQLPSVVDELQATVVPLSIPLAFSISVLVGVVFGIYPALRAAKMDPIEALRHE